MLGLLYFRFSRIDRGRLVEMLRVDVEGIGETVRQLKQFEPELYAQMKREIINEPGVASVISQIEANVPPVSPLQGNQQGQGGMLHNGRTRYEIPKVRVYQRPQATLGRAGAERSLIGFEAISPGNAAGFEILDLVGRGPNRNSRNAQGMLKKLEGNASRYVWKGYEKRKDGVSRAVFAIVQRYANKVNVKLKVM
jgi:hypothetical protein